MSERVHQFAHIRNQAPSVRKAACGALPDRCSTTGVTAGLLPAIHALLRSNDDVDARDMRGHDDVNAGTISCAS